MKRLLAALCLYYEAVAVQAAPPVLFGSDAEFGVATRTSAQAVRHGIEIALDETAAAACSAVDPWPW